MKFFILSLLILASSFTKTAVIDSVNLGDDDEIMEIIKKNLGEELSVIDTRADHTELEVSNELLNKYLPNASMIETDQTKEIYNCLNNDDCTLRVFKVPCLAGGESQDTSINFAVIKGDDLEVYTEILVGED